MSTATLQTQAKTKQKHLDFTELFQTHHQRLYEMVLSMTRNHEAAEDVTATAFAKAFAHRSSFRGEAAPYTWLYAIARNEVLARRQDWRTTPLDEARVEELPEPNQRDPEWQRLQDQLTQGLRQIPSVYRRTLVNHFFRRQPVSQIAKCGRIPIGTVLSRIHKGKQLLREAVRD